MLQCLSSDKVCSRARSFSRQVKAAYTAAGKSEKVALDIADSMSGQNRVNANKLVRWTYTTKETKEKVKTDNAVVMKVKEAIDQGKITTANQIQTALANKATPADTKNVVNYLAKGGNKQGLKDSGVRTMYRAMFQQAADEVDPNAYQYTWNYIENGLDPGKLPTDSDVRKLMLEAQLQFKTEGELAGGSFFGRGRDKSFAEAVEDGKADEWLPDVTGIEEKTIKAELRKLGRDLTEANIRAYKKHVTLKIPWSGNQYE